MFGERECHPMSKKANPAALLPILVFLVLYLGLGLIFEYVLKIPMGFYSIPIVVIFLIALLVACCQNREFSRNLSFIAQPCPLQAAMVVSEMKLRLSPNIAPPMTDATHSGRE